MGRTRSTASAKLAGANRSRTVVRAPARSGVRMLTAIALTWKSGRTRRQWSSAPIRNAASICAVMASRFAWSSMTPLGRPVDPLV